MASTHALVVTLALLALLAHSSVATTPQPPIPAECATAACVHCHTELEQVTELSLDCLVCSVCFKGQCLNATALSRDVCGTCADGWMGDLCTVEIPRTGHYGTDTSMSTGSAFMLVLIFGGLITGLYVLYKRHVSTAAPSYHAVVLTDLESPPTRAVTGAGALRDLQVSSEEGEVTIELVDE